MAMTAEVLGIQKLSKANIAVLGGFLGVQVVGTKKICIDQLIDHMNKIMMIKQVEEEVVAKEQPEEVKKGQDVGDKPIMDKEAGDNSGGGGGSDKGNGSGSGSGSDNGCGGEGDGDSTSSEKDSYQISVKRMDNHATMVKNISVMVNYSDSVDSLKSQLKGKEGIPRSQQHLIFGNSQLEDHFTMGNYGIEKDSVINLFIRGRGGAGKKAGVIKITKAERMMLAQSRATILYANVKPFTVEPSLASKADTKYQELIKATETDMELLIKSLSLRDLHTSQASMEEFVLNEQSIHRLAPLFLKEFRQLSSTVDSLHAAMKSLEAAFSYMFSNCYYSEYYAKFDFVSFNAMVEATIKEKELEKELKAKHGICEDVDEDL